MKTATLTWTIKFETVEGAIKTAKFRTETLDKAIDALCRETRVGNLIEAWQGKTRWM